MWQKSHTFQPTLDAVSKRLAELSQPSRAVRYSEPDNLLSAIEAERQRKQRRIEQSRNSLEYDTLKGCTFNPRTNENVPDKTTEGGAADKTTDAAGGEAGKSLRRKSKVEVKPDVARRRRSSAPVVVRGLGRHLELQEAAKRKEKMKEQRAEEVFHVAKSALEVSATDTRTHATLTSCWLGLAGGPLFLPVSVVLIGCCVGVVAGTCRAIHSAQALSAIHRAALQGPCPPHRRRHPQEDGRWGFRG